MRDCRVLLALLLVAAGDSAADGLSAPSAAQGMEAITRQADNVAAATAHPRRTLTLPDLDGAPHSLTEWQGKVVLLNFWASWCAPCQYEIRDLVAWQEKYGAQGLQVVGVGMDVVQKLRNVQRTLEINYPVLVADPSRYPNVMAAWGNRAGTVPHTVVLNREGSVVYIHRGLMSEETFAENILPLLEHSEHSP